MDAPSGITSLNYYNDTMYCNWNTETDISTPEMVIENIGNAIQDNNIGELLNIKTELLESVADSFFKDLEKDDELLKEVKEIDENISVFKKVMEKITAQQQKVSDIELLYKQSIDETKGDLEKIDTFHQFLKDILNKFPEKDNTEINTIKEDIVSLGKKIQSDNNCSVIRGEYHKELYLLNEYHRLLRKINNGNVGNTCSLCLQKSVSAYFNPCGHTACEDCIKLLYEKSENQYNVNCFICRKRINSNHPIYFI